MSQKERYTDRRRNLYPIGYLNSQLARPLTAVACAVRLTPNQVSYLSLIVSLAGFAMIATLRMWEGAALVYLGLLLDHADGQVARSQGSGSTWGMYLDMVIDRIVELGLIVSLAVAGMAAIPSPLAEPLVFGPTAWLALCVTTAGAILIWRFLTAYNDVLYLRSHLMATGTMPQAGDAKPIMKRPLIPFVYTRDWMILIWAIGTSIGWAHVTVALLLVIHLLQMLEKIIVFKKRHGKPEKDAARILGKDYH